MKLTRRAATALLACAASLGLVTAPATAAPDCSKGQTAFTPVLSGQGVLESVIVDDGGRLFYTDTSLKALMRLDFPGAAPALVAGGIDAPGGLAIDGDGTILVGQGDGFVPGTLGNVSPAARLLRVHPDTGATSEFARGLRMANGVVRAADGTVYASSDVGVALDRVSADGTVVTNDWAQVISANGLAIDSTGRWLFAAQTFQPAAIQRVEIADPANVTTYAAAGVTDWAAGPDGMDIDPSDRLVVAANGAGQVWRVGTDRRICVLARGLLFPSAVAYGRGTSGFSAGRLFVVTFSGVVAEVPAGRLG